MQGERRCVTVRLPLPPAPLSIVGSSFLLSSVFICISITFALQACATNPKARTTTMATMSTTLTAEEFDRRKSVYAKTLRWAGAVSQVAGIQWASIDEQFRRDRQMFPSIPNLSLVDLILGQIHTESGGEQYARGKAGELGLLQLMPMTARDMGIDVPPKGYTVDEVARWKNGENPYPVIFDPLTNIGASVRYTHRIFLQLRQRGWSGTAFSTYLLALAGYNGGPGYVMAAIKDKVGEEMLDETIVLREIREGMVKLGGTTRMSNGSVVPIIRTAPAAMAHYPVLVIEHAQMIHSVRPLDNPAR